MDPDTLEIRYIGKTGNIKNRYSSHISNAKRLKSRLANWIKYLAKSNKLPIIDIIEECIEESWEQREIYWISYYQSNKLCNNHIGGKLQCKDYLPKTTAKKYDIYKGKYRVRCSYLNTVYYIGEFNTSKKAIKAYNLFYTNPLSFIKLKNVQHFREKQKKTVLVYKNNINISEFSSVAECAAFYNIDPANIARCCRNKAKSCNKLVFKYK